MNLTNLFNTIDFIVLFYATIYFIVSTILIKKNTMSTLGAFIFRIIFFIVVIMYCTFDTVTHFMLYGQIGIFNILAIIYFIFRAVSTSIIFCNKSN